MWEDCGESWGGVWGSWGDNLVRLLIGLGNIVGIMRRESCESVDIVWKECGDIVARVWGYCGESVGRVWI